MLIASADLGAQSAPLGIPDTRMGSGTAWVPDASPMHAVHSMVGSWSVMTHGVATLHYLNQGGLRGGEQVGSLNWLMVGGTRPAFGGRVGLRGMFSLEPFTLPAWGYPLLFQTGETYKGKPIADAQHPHEMFMELAANWERAVSDKLGVSVYVAPVGEPAAGPTYYGHRPSAANDPFAPLGHHWQDATHVAFGTATLGVFSRTLRVEGSLFNGHEPDETRTNFDFADARLDSWAARISWNPTANWSSALSHASIDEHRPRPSDPSKHAMTRTTVSVQFARAFAGERAVAIAGVLGVNNMREEGGSRAWLAEGTFALDSRNSLFSRVESVEKHREDLQLPEMILAGGGVPDQVRVTSFSAGYMREFAPSGGLTFGVGARASIHMVPGSVGQFYGSASPTALALYLRVRPTGSAANPHAGHKMP
jgi:hypothetical protein